MKRAGVSAAIIATAIAMGPGCSSQDDNTPRAPESGGSSALASAEPFDSECGPDVIALLERGDPDVLRLQEESPQDLGVQWLDGVRCLADNGDAEAQVTLGIVYRDGSDGPPQDYAEAAAWFQRAADQGNPMAKFNLGQMYENGRGVPLDLVQAHMWYNLAATRFDSRTHAMTRSLAFERRDAVEGRMTSAQVREAQGMATSRRPSDAR